MNRYLTKLCDQLVCLLSAEHSQAIVCDGLDKVDDLDDLSLDLENDDSELLIDFTVEKRDKQDERVVVRQGFTVRCHPIHDFPTMTQSPFAVRWTLHILSDHQISLSTKSYYLPGYSMGKRRRVS